MKIFFYILIASILLSMSSPVSAQGTQLAPPGVKWGAAGIQTPMPVQQVGYDSTTSLPCIVGSTATCTSSGSGAAVTALPTTGTGGQNAITVTNTSAQLLAARVAPQYALSIKNESTTESIAFCFAAACTAALNTAGSITLAPGQLYSESPAFIHLDRINGISSAATSPATIQAN